MSEPTTDAPTTEPETTEPVTTDWEAEATKWKELARKHEDRAKSNNAAAKELEKLREQSLSDTEKAVAAARREGETEALKKAGGKLARAELKAAAKGIIPDGIVAAIDVNQFLDEDGEVDTAAIEKFVSDNTPEPSEPENDKPSFVDFGQGKRGDAPGLNSTQLERDMKIALGIS